MLDQLIIGEKASFDDFVASLKTKTTKAPKKKSIKETVPFANVTYDFSAINGEVYWEERELEYVFEIIAPTPEDLERKRIAFTSWVMNVMGENIFDPFIPDYHYTNCTFGDISYADDEDIEKTTITVKFTAYPYQVANIPRVYKFTIPAEGETTEVIVNDSSHRISPTFVSDLGATLKMDGTSYAIPAGETMGESFKLKPGANSVTITGTGEESTLTVKFYEEVF